MFIDTDENPIAWDKILVSGKEDLERRYMKAVQDARLEYMWKKT